MRKDSYAPSDNDPATGATRRLTVLAYLNVAQIHLTCEARSVDPAAQSALSLDQDWHDGYGGELRIHSGGERPDPRQVPAFLSRPFLDYGISRRYRNVEPKACEQMQGIR